MRKAIKIIVNGRVQGVGFRPFIFQLALANKIKGTVQNNMDGVSIIAEGEYNDLQQFITSIKRMSPRLSRIDRVHTEEISYNYYQDFTIIPSDRNGKSSLVIPIDSAVCNDCLTEMSDPNNFRFQYPFINCTQCGPRYSIISELPYDRPFTSMESFEMCDKCRSEYEDPTNRRHHAQPIACPVCGPSVELLSMNSETIAKNQDAIEHTINLLEQGYIVAIKGIGGYHLACDAYNKTAISQLRINKGRLHRPLAVMANTIDVARELCDITTKEAEILQSPEAPIVVLSQKNNELPKELAPGMSSLGIMLPYTPLHHLIFDNSSLKTLVMTSANPSGMPILYKDDLAFQYLKGIADFILTNNREILHPLDDSVVQVIDEEVSYIRRSRGYVPDPLVTQHKVNNIVALGGQLKNTFAIGRNQQIFLSPHIGEMENIEVIDFHRRELQHLMKWMGTEAKVLAIDKHPNFSTKSIAEEMDGLIVPVQHHHAHFVSCIEDNQIDGEAFGIILDGTGYGDDGNIWGFEILYGNSKSYKRLAHLKYTPLPSGENAIREPWKNAVGMIIRLIEDGKSLAKKLFPDKEYEIDILNNMIEKRINSPLAGTCGRLFDAVSAILQVCKVSTYDGEAAILLSEFVTNKSSINNSYSYRIVEDENEVLEIDFKEMIVQIINDYFNKRSIEEIAHLFHQTIVTAITEILSVIINKFPKYNTDVVFSGGSFHNSYLKRELKRSLIDLNFNVYTHKNVPCNDGGLALGQLIIAANYKN